jgi:rhodanese-related sulfurtransferase
MKTILAVTVLIIMSFTASPAFPQESAFDTYLTNFDYETRAEMKIDSKELVKLVSGGKAVLLDIRFPEEVAAWKFGFSTNIPLNELPKRCKELPKDKIIVTACPHKDRSAIAMAYLRTRGYNAKYLTDGLVGLAEYLRGDKAKDFVEEIKHIPSRHQ